MKKYPTNRHFSELSLVKASLDEIGIATMFIDRNSIATIKQEVLVKVKNKYWKRALDYIVRKKGSLPKITKTEAIKELLNRGFIHCSDTKVVYQRHEPQDYAMVISNLGELVLDRKFETEEEAFEHNIKVGIPGITIPTKIYHKK